MPLKRGDTFLIPKNPKETEHLWVVVTEVDEHSKKAICVNVTTRRPYSDTTCVLMPGDHPFVQHESVINFSDAREMAIDLVEQALAKRIRTFVCEAHDPCSEILLQRIQRGLLDSKYTPKGIKAQCRKLWGQE